MATPLSPVERRRLALLLALGAVLRLSLIPSHGVWLDEAHSLSFAARPGLQFLEALRNDAGCPFYFALLKAWTGLWGDGTAAASLLSVVASAAVPGFAFVAADRWFGRPTAWLAAACAILNTQSLQYSVEIRWYAWLELLTAAAWALLPAAVDSRPARIAYAIVCLLGLYTHPYFVLVMVSHVALVAVTRPPGWKILIAPWAAALLAFLPWAMVLWQQPLAGELAEMLPRVPSFGAAVTDFVVTIADKLDPEPTARLWLARGLVVLLPLGLAWAVAKRQRMVLAVGLSYFLCVGVPTLVSMVHPVFVMHRYDTVALLPFELVLAYGLSRLPRPAQGLAVALMLLAAGTFWLHLTDHQDTDRQTVAALRPIMTPSDVVIYTGLSRLAPDYYFHQFGLSYAASFMYPPDLEAHPGYILPSRYEGQDEVLETEASTLVDGILARPFTHVLLFYNDPATSVSPGQARLGPEYEVLRALLEQKLKLQQTLPVRQHPYGPFYNEVLVYGRR